MSGTEYIWSHLLYTTGDGPRYRVVAVLAWHGDTATVLPLRDDAELTSRPIGGLQAEIGAEPYVVKVSDLRFGRLPA